MKNSSSVLLVLLATAFSVFGSVDNTLVALVPANSQTIAGIDVEKCRASDFGQYLLSKSQAEDPHFEQFMSETGFDPRRDLQSLIMTSSSDGAGKKTGFAILARGNFDESKIRSLAISKGAVAETYQGFRLLINKETDHGQSTAVGFPDAGLAIMGDLSSIHQVIQNFKTPGVLNADLANRIQSAGSANDAWFVSAEGGAMLGKAFSAHTGGQMEPQGQALQSITAASGGIRFGSQVAVTMDAFTRSPEDALSLADVFRFAASMVQMGRQKDPRAALLADSLDNMQLKISGQTVHVALSMSEKNLEQIAEANPQPVR